MVHDSLFNTKVELSNFNSKNNMNINLNNNSSNPNNNYNPGNTANSTNGFNGFNSGNNTPGLGSHPKSVMSRTNNNNVSNNKNSHTNNPNNMFFHKTQFTKTHNKLMSVYLQKKVVPQGMSFNVTQKIKMPSIKFGNY